VDTGSAQTELLNTVSNTKKCVEFDSARISAIYTTRTGWEVYSSPLLEMILRQYSRVVGVKKSQFSTGIYRHWFWPD